MHHHKKRIAHLFIGVRLEKWLGISYIDDLFHLDLNLNFLFDVFMVSVLLPILSIATTTFRENFCYNKYVVARKILVHNINRWILLYILMRHNILDQTKITKWRWLITHEKKHTCFLHTIENHKLSTIIFGNWTYVRGMYEFDQSQMIYIVFSMNVQLLLIYIDIYDMCLPVLLDYNYGINHLTMTTHIIISQLTDRISFAQALPPLYLGTCLPVPLRC
ncbi:hypothetical protein ACJX0J_009287 [Zea mays]